MFYAGVRVDAETLDTRLRAEWPLIVARLDAAGYDGDFEVLGAGMTSVVLMGADGLAYKVAREGAARMLADEFDFLQTMHRTEAAPHLPTPVRFDPVASVLVREAVSGVVGRWGTRGLRDVFERIARVARENGWTAPEYKESSFVTADDGRVVMIDVGFANRLGFRLVAYVLALLDSGTPISAQEARDYAWALRMDASDGLTDPAMAAALQARLEQLVGQKLD